jgi:LysR substrate binding domain-containing protein
MESNWIFTNEPLQLRMIISGSVVVQLCIVILSTRVLDRIGCRSKFEREGIKFKPLVRCESPEVVKEFVRLGAGVGFLYLNSIRRGIERRQFKPIQLPGLDLVGQSYIVYSNEKPLSSLAREFLSFLRASVTSAGLMKSAIRQISNGHQNGSARDHVFPPKLLSWIISVASLEWIYLLFA